jgi:hypothetical protein
MIMGLLPKLPDNTSLLTYAMQKVQFYKATRLQANIEEACIIRPIASCSVAAQIQYHETEPERIQFWTYEEFQRRFKESTQAPWHLTYEPKKRVSAMLGILDGITHKAGFEFESNLAYGLCVKLAELGEEDLARFLDLEIESRRG